MDIISLGFSLFTMLITFWKPEVGIALAAQAYLIRNAFMPAASLINTTTENNTLSVVLPVLVFLIITIKAFKVRRFYQVKALDILLIILGILLLINSFFSPNTSLGFSVSVRYFALGISFYFFARLIPLTNIYKPQESFITVIFSTWLLAILLGAIALFTTDPQGLGFSRLAIGSSNPIPFSLNISMAILANTYFILFHNKMPLYIRFFSYISLGILTLLLVATQTRSMLLALTVTIIFMIYQLLKKQISLKIITIIAISLIVCAVVTYGIICWQPLLFEQWTRRVLLAFSFSDNLDRSIAERILAKDIAIKLFNNNFLFGVGTGGFSFYTSLPYAHNLLLEIACEQGLFGLCILLIILAIILYQVFGNNYIKTCCPISILFSALVLLNLIVAQFSYTLWQHKNLYLFLGLLIACITTNCKPLSCNSQMQRNSSY